MVSEGDIVVWTSQWNNRIVGEVEETRTGQDICSEKSDYCLRPDEDEQVAKIEHWDKEDGLRTPSGEGATVHYDRNLDVLECEDNEDHRVCHGPERDFSVGY